MLRLVTCMCVLTVAASCILVSKPALKTDEITVFLTGNELGVLKPCGCSSGQLGGFERRAAVFDSVPVNRRMIVNTGGLVKSDGEQDLIKFDILVQAFNLLGYDVVNLTEEDMKIAGGLGLIEGIGSLLNVMTFYGPTDSNLPTSFTKNFSLKDQTVAVTVAVFDAESSPVELIERLFVPQAGVQTVNILILNRSAAGMVSTVAKKGIVDCLICPAESDEPVLLSEPGKRPLVISIGRFGRYICKLQIKPAKDKGKPNLSFIPIPVKEELPRKSSLITLYEDYQLLVKEANLIEKIQRFTLPGGLEYTGSRSCKGCHEYEYDKWSTKDHAQAYATLERVGSELDPECVGCHVVGLKYESGFVSVQETGDLKDVGCEACHGPGSEHIKSLGKAETTGPKQECVECHTPDNSGNYAGNEKLYFEKIIHWREPNSLRDVK